MAASWVTLSNLADASCTLFLLPTRDPELFVKISISSVNWETDPKGGPGASHGVTQSSL